MNPRLLSALLLLVSLPLAAWTDIYRTLNVFAESADECQLVPHAHHELAISALNHFLMQYLPQVGDADPFFSINTCSAAAEHQLRQAIHSGAFRFSTYIGANGQNVIWVDGGDIERFATKGRRDQPMVTYGWFYYIEYSLQDEMWARALQEPGEKIDSLPQLTAALKADNKSFTRKILDLLPESPVYYHDYAPFFERKLRLLARFDDSPRRIFSEQQVREFRGELLTFAPRNSLSPQIRAAFAPLTLRMAQSEVDLSKDCKLVAVCLIGDLPKAEERALITHLLTLAQLPGAAPATSPCLQDVRKYFKRQTGIDILTQPLPEEAPSADRASAITLP